MLIAVALGHAALSGGAPPALPGFLNSLSSPLEHFGLWVVLLLVLVEDFGIPVPGETVLIAASIFAGSGRLNVVAVGLVGFFAAVLGDNIGYAIGRFGGRALVERWGKYVFLTPERLDKAENFFARHGGKIITVARFIEGLRQANGLIAGITEMHWLRFIAFNALGAALWVGTWVSIGYFAGRNITSIYNSITNYSLLAAIVALAAIAAWVFFRLRKRRRERAASAEDALAQDAPAQDAAAQDAAEQEAAAQDAAAQDARDADWQQAAATASPEAAEAAEPDDHAEPDDLTGPDEATGADEATGTAQRHEPGGHPAANGHGKPGVHTQSGPPPGTTGGASGRGAH